MIKGCLILMSAVSSLVISAGKKYSDNGVGDRIHKKYQGKNGGVGVGGGSSKPLLFPSYMHCSLILWCNHCGILLREDSDSGGLGFLAVPSTTRQWVKHAVADISVMFIKRQVYQVS